MITRSVLSNPSVAAFLSKDKSSQMYVKPWRQFFDEQDRRFKAQWKPEHPAYEARWDIHQLHQRKYLAEMAYFHAGLSADARFRHELRQLRVVGEMSSALWNSVVFPSKREVVAAA